MNNYNWKRKPPSKEAIKFQKDLSMLRQYNKIVSKKLDDFMIEYSKDPYEMAWLTRLSYQTLWRIYWSKEDDILKLAHVSACIDAIRHNRYEQWWTWSLFGPVTEQTYDYRDIPEYYLYRE